MVLLLLLLLLSPRLGSRLLGGSWLLAAARWDGGTRCRRVGVCALRRAATACMHAHRLHARLPARAQVEIMMALEEKFEIQLDEEGGCACLHASSSMRPDLDSGG